MLGSGHEFIECSMATELEDVIEAFGERFKKDQSLATEECFLFSSLKMKREFVKGQISAFLVELLLCFEYSENLSIFHLIPPKELKAIENQLKFLERRLFMSKKFWLKEESELVSILKPSRSFERVKYDVIGAVDALSIHCRILAYSGMYLKKMMEEQKADSISPSYEQIENNCIEIKNEILSCSACLEEVLERAKSLLSEGDTVSINGETTSESYLNEERVKEIQNTVKLYGLEDPIIEDEVFEAVVDSYAMDNKDVKDEIWLESVKKERRVKKKQKERWRRVLQEVQPILLQRREMWREREAKAIRRKAAAGGGTKPQDVAVNKPDDSHELAFDKEKTPLELAVSKLEESHEFAIDKEKIPHELSVMERKSTLEFAVDKEKTRHDLTDNIGTNPQELICEENCVPFKCQSGKGSIEMTSHNTKNNSSESGDSGVNSPSDGFRPITNVTLASDLRNLETSFKSNGTEREKSAKEDNSTPFQLDSTSNPKIEVEEYDSEEERLLLYRRVRKELDEDEARRGSESDDWSDSESENEATSNDKMHGENLALFSRAFPPSAKVPGHNWNKIFQDGVPVLAASGEAELKEKKKEIGFDDIDFESRLRETRENLKDHKDYLENQEECVRSAKEYLPNSEEYLPSKEEYHPNKKEYLRSQEDCMQHEGEYLKNKKEYLQSQEDCIQHKGEYLKNKKEYLQCQEDCIQHDGEYLKSHEECLQNRMVYLPNQKGYLSNEEDHQNKEDNLQNHQQSLPFSLKTSDLPVCDNSKSFKGSSPHLGQSGPAVNTKCKQNYSCGDSSSEEEQAIDWSSCGFADRRTGGGGEVSPVDSPVGISLPSLPSILSSDLRQKFKIVGGSEEVFGGVGEGESETESEDEVSDS